MSLSNYLQAIVGLVPEHQASIRLGLPAPPPTFLFPPHLCPFGLVGQQAAPELCGCRIACYILGSTPTHPSKHSFTQMSSLPAPRDLLASKCQQAFICCPAHPSPSHICLPSYLSPTIHLLLSSFQSQLLQKSFPPFCLLSEHSSVFIKLSWNAL